MHLLQLEASILRVVGQLADGNVPEDARLELKAFWPADHAKAARQLAGHANAAFGEPILWIVGLDERRGAVGVTSAEKTEWLARVFSFFDGVTPSVQDLVVNVGDATVVAMLFETVRAPFVVRNPQFGSEPTPISHEVPWRDATRVRSARREDLVRLLGEHIALPDIECLSADLRLVEHPGVATMSVSATVNIYAVPKAGTAVVIPFHRSQMIVNRGEVRLSITSGRPYARQGLMLVGPEGKTSAISHTVHGAGSEVIFEGPGSATLSGAASIAAAHDWSDEVDLQLMLAVIGAGHPLILDVPLRATKPTKRGNRIWKYPP